MLCLTLDSGCFAAFMRIGVRENKASVQTDFRIQPAVSMGWILQVVFPKKHNIADQRSFAFRGIRQFLLPTVKTASLDPHRVTEYIYRELS